MKSDIIGRGWTFPPKIGAQGGVSLTNERSEIDQAIRIILTTMPGQRVMRPEFGCRLYELIFQPNNARTASQAVRYVEEALQFWEPRIRLADLEAGPDPDAANRLLITIKYEIKATHDMRSLVFPFYLIPEE
jgi:phage baseplate assembly protein W